MSIFRIVIIVLNTVIILINYINGSTSIATYHWPKDNSNNRPRPNLFRLNDNAVQVYLNNKRSSPVFLKPNGHIHFKPPHQNMDFHKFPRYSYPIITMDLMNKHRFYKNGLPLKQYWMTSRNIQPVQLIKNSAILIRSVPPSQYNQQPTQKLIEYSGFNKSENTFLKTLTTVFPKTTTTTTTTTQSNYIAWKPFKQINLCETQLKVYNEENTSCKGHQKDEFYATNSINGDLQLSSTNPQSFSNFKSYRKKLQGFTSTMAPLALSHYSLDNKVFSSFTIDDAITPSTHNKYYTKSLNSSNTILNNFSHSSYKKLDNSITTANTPVFITDAEVQPFKLQNQFSFFSNEVSTQMKSTALPILETTETVKPDLILQSVTTAIPIRKDIIYYGKLTTKPTPITTEITPTNIVTINPTYNVFKTTFIRNNTHLSTTLYPKLENKTIENTRIKLKNYTRIETKFKKDDMAQARIENYRQENRLPATKQINRKRFRQIINIKNTTILPIITSTTYERSEKKNHKTRFNIAPKLTEYTSSTPKSITRRTKSINTTGIFNNLRSTEKYKPILETKHPKSRNVLLSTAPSWRPKQSASKSIECRGNSTENENCKNDFSSASERIKNSKNRTIKHKANLTSTTAETAIMKINNGIRNRFITSNISPKSMSTEVKLLIDPKVTINNINTIYPKHGSTVIPPLPIEVYFHKVNGVN